MAEKSPRSIAGRQVDAAGARPRAAALAAPPRLASSLMEIQRAVGNQAVGRLLAAGWAGSGAALQARLRIGRPGDAFESEAERVAAAVTGSQAPGGGQRAISAAQVAAAAADGGGTVRRCARCGGGQVSEQTAAAAEAEAQAGGGPAGTVQRQCRCQQQDDDETMQSREVPGATPRVPDGFAAQLDGLRGGGAALSPGLRGFFEPRFGYDFGDVRLHLGTQAERAAEAVDARAFTLGNDVVFGRGEYAPDTPAGRHLLAHELTHVVQQTPLVARREPLVQREPLPAGAQAAGSDTAAVPAPGAAAAPPALSAPAEAEPAAPQPDSATATPADSPRDEFAVTQPGSMAPGSPAAETAAGVSQAGAPALVVEDDAAEVGSGQMKKSDFLARLHDAVRAAADAGLAGTERSSEGCPLIEFWFSTYENQRADRINRDLPRFWPAGAHPAAAADSIPLIAARVQASVAVWARTGEITGVPAGIPLPGMGLVGSLLGSGGRAAAAGPGGLLFKARSGGPRDAAQPQALRAQLGPGRPLDGGTRSRMESAFGESFAHVRMHTDAAAAGLSDRLNARAFTVGSHVAFGPQEYRPGTLGGDALIAHELAHVVQQGGASESFAPLAPGGDHDGLEQDADTAAAGAVLSLWGAAGTALRGAARQAVPRLRSGLRLQRCKNDAPAAASGSAATAGSATAPASSPAAAATPPHLTKTLVSGPTPTDCGGYDWIVQWVLDNPSVKGGWVVQKLEFIFHDAKDCKDKAPDADDAPYWEAWQINAGQKITTYAEKKDTHDDEFQLDAKGESTKGSITEKGTAEFYEGLTLPATFVVDRTSPAGILPMTRSAPTLTGGTGSLDHKLVATWDCCLPKGAKTTTLTTT